MTVAPAVLHRALRAIVWAYKIELNAGGASAYPLSDEAGAAAAAQPADPPNVDAPLAGGGSAG